MANKFHRLLAEVSQKGSAGGGRLLFLRYITNLLTGTASETRLFGEDSVSYSTSTKSNDAFKVQEDLTNVNPRFSRWLMRLSDT